MNFKHTFLFIIGMFFSFTTTSFATSPNDLVNLYKQLGLKTNISFSTNIVVKVQGPKKPISDLQTTMHYKNSNIRLSGKESGIKFTTLYLANGDIYTKTSLAPYWMQSDLKTQIGNQTLPQYQKIGPEKVDNKECIRFEVSDKTVGVTSILWVYQDYIYQNEITSPNGKTIVRYENFKLEELDDSLFSIPEGEVVQKF